MRIAKIVMVAAVMCLVSSSGFALNSMAVTGAAALEGSFGLAITMDGSANKVYVQDNTPADETVYRAQFMLKMTSNYSMTGPDNHVIFRAWDDTGDTPFRLTIGQFRDGRYFIRAFFLQDNGNFRFIGGTIIQINGTYTIGVEWKAGAGDGEFRLLRNGVVAQEYLNCNNGNYEVDYVRLGATVWADPATSGTYYLDSFESYRTLAP